MIGRVVAARTPNVRDWLPVLFVPPVLVLGAAITGSDGHPITALGVLAAIVGCLPLVLRRRIPFPFFALPLTAGIVLVVWQLNPGDVVVLIPMIALFDIAQFGDRRRSLWIGAVTVPCVAVSVIPFTKGGLLAVVAFNLMLCLLTIGAGDMLRSRQVTAQRTAAAREQETLRRVGEQRLQVAREIHDVVAHAMTAINVQAGVAAHLLERDPAHAHDALRDIKRTSGDALNDLRATLDVLRDPEQSAPITSPVGLEDLDALTGGLRAAGVAVDLEVAPVADLPAPVQSAGYRIIQEALTNVARHAQASAARVRVSRERDAVTIEVSDDGAATAGVGSRWGPAGPAGEGAPSGNGLRGMRERALALGGSLEAAPAGAGGWLVRARLPISPDVSDPRP
ncbi:MAG: sensor histidine kinase [Solirubrobacteraceae bacterium]